MGRYKVTSALKLETWEDKSERIRGTWRRSKIY